MYQIIRNRFLGFTGQLVDSSVCTSRADSAAASECAEELAQTYCTDNPGATYSRDSNGFIVRIASQRVAEFLVQSA